MDIDSIVKAAGGASRVARELGRNHATILGWKRVPAEHARVVARLAGLEAHEVRPDLYDALTPRQPEPPLPERVS